LSRFLDNIVDPEIQEMALKVQQANQHVMEGLAKQEVAK